MLTLAATDMLRSGGRSLSRQIRLVAILVLALGLLVYGVMMSPPALTVPALALGSSLMLVGVSLGLVDLTRHLVLRRATRMMAEFIENDAAPSLISNEDGAVVSANPAARDRFQIGPGHTLAGVLDNVFQDPSAVLFRLQNAARRNGATREDIAARTGAVRLSVLRLRRRSFLWRIEELNEGHMARRSAESLPFPVLTLGKSGTILAMNDAARELAGGRVTALDRLLIEPPFQPGAVNRIITARGPQRFRALEQPIQAGRSEVFLLPDGPPEAQITGLDALPVAILMLDPEGRVLSANPAATALVGQDVQSGLRLSDIMEGLGRPIADWLEETTAGRTTSKSEFLRLIRRDSEMFVQVTLSSCCQDGEDRLIAVLNDATELKTLEAQFVQSQKMQAIGQLAGGVAHDFNNLLTAISGHCDLMLLRHDQGDEDYSDLMQINQNANRAASLVGQLLAFSRKQTLRPEVLDVRDTLSDLTHLLNRLVGERVTLTLVHDPVLGAIRADKRQLEQVLMNLVVNARDAMPEGGEIRIETETLTLTEPVHRDRAVLPVGEYVQVRVTDEGVGIPAEKLQKVFEPFYTTKRTGEGTGLGLSTAYGIVKQTGGFIFVDSTLGRGTAFTLIFPARRFGALPVEGPPGRTVSRAPKHGQGIVLLVEDEAPVRAFATRALRLRGYTVIEAESGEAALEILEDDDLLVDVFVTDVVMPGLDGPSWVRRALKARPNVRVVFVSGYAEGAFRDSDPGVENSTFLQKPFSLNQLTDTVHDQLNIVGLPGKQDQVSDA